MRCLILGATGQIGSQLVRACCSRDWAHLGSRYQLPHHEYVPLDIRDEQSVDDLIADYQPDVTFLAAGVPAAGYAERFAAETHAIHGTGARIVAQSVARHGGRLVQFTPDTVFGECPQARREDDTPDTNGGELVRSKLAAEAIVRELLPERHLIVRTGWLFGPDERGHGLFGSFRRKLAQGESVEVAVDRFGQPTYAPDLAEAVLQLLESAQNGTFHIVGPDKHSESTWARLLCHVFDYDVDQLEEVRAATLMDSDPRPQRVWLDRFKVRSLLGPRCIRTTAEGLRATRDALQQMTVGGTLPLSAAA
ncbi:MAG: sugar nucleotide-binding protein [Bacteroidales bacterium]|nr:sugar nucleotide-binding protein [Bacteroidales bacterium]